MRKNKLNLLGLFLAATMAFGLVGCGSAEAETSGNTNAVSEVESEQEEDVTSTELKTIRIGGIAQGDYFSGSPGVAQQLGYLDEELAAVGYQAEIASFQNGPALNEAYASGEIDVAISIGELPAVTAKSQGIDSRVFAVTGNIQYAILGKEDEEFTSLKDLEGKKVAIYVGTVLQYFLESAANDAGVDISAIEYVNDASISTFLTGDVDYVVIAHYIADTYEAQGYGKIVYSTVETGDYQSQSVSFGSEEYIEENTEAIQAIINALSRVQEYAQNDPEGYYQLLSDNTNGTFLPESFAAEYAADPEFDALSQVIDDEAVEKLQKVIDFAKDSGLITESIDASEWVYYLD